MMSFWLWKVKYEKKDSFALFADLFRLHMLAKNPGMIWIDTDVYCHRPMTYDSPYVLGFELPGDHRVNNAVLGLPADSALLQSMLDYTSDPFAIPPFVKPKLQDDYRKAAAQGHPVHVSQQPWAVWGPMMVTHCVSKCPGPCETPSTTMSEHDLETWVRVAIPASSSRRSAPSGTND